METLQTIPTTSLPPAVAAAAVTEGREAERPPAEPEAASPSGWMVLLRIVAYLIVLPAAVLAAVRYLFQFLE